MSIVIVSGLPTEATCQDFGIPFSLAISLRVRALAAPVTPIQTRERNDKIATFLATQAIL